MNDHRVVEQVGDVTFLVSAHPSLELAMLRAVDLCAAADEDRELFVDGPQVDGPVPVGNHHTVNN